MFCSNCGKDLPDDANFCIRCGKPQKEGVTIFGGVAETKYETCEIEWEALDELVFFGPGKARFLARAIGPMGAYIALQTDYYKNSEENKMQQLKWLIDRLVKDGWEPTGRGERRDNYKFRRAIRPNAQY